MIRIELRTKEKKRKNSWYARLKALKTVLWTIIPIATFSLGFAIPYMLYVSPDFGISVDNTKITLTPGHDNINTIRVQDLNLKHYNYSIYLYSEIIPLDGSRHQEGIIVKFDNDGSHTGTPFDSEVILTAPKNLSDGHYRLKITAFGGDGKERSCQINLYTRAN
jgi:hypothetical protein